MADNAVMDRVGRSSGRRTVAVRAVEARDEGGDEALLTPSMKLHMILITIRQDQDVSKSDVWLILHVLNSVQLT